jgi:hypothetical protein
MDNYQGKYQAMANVAKLSTQTCKKLRPLSTEIFSDCGKKKAGIPLKGNYQIEFSKLVWKYFNRNQSKPA